MNNVVIRVWHGCTVVHVVSIGPTGSTTLGGVGGSECSMQVDIELDPWAGLIVDNRAAFPKPERITQSEDIDD